MRLEPAGPGRNRRLLSLTPIIDVVFLLLLFFMLASTFSRFAHVDIGVAGGTASAPAGETTRILLSVNGRGFAVNGRAVEAPGIGAALNRQAGQAEAVILVRPSGDAPAQDLVRAVEEARASGLGSVVLVR